MGAGANTLSSYVGKRPRFRGQAGAVVAHFCHYRKQSRLALQGNRLSDAESSGTQSGIMLGGEGVP